MTTPSPAAGPANGSTLVTGTPQPVHSSISSPPEVTATMRAPLACATRAAATVGWSSPDCETATTRDDSESQAGLMPPVASTGTEP